MKNILIWLGLFLASLAFCVYMSNSTGMSFVFFASVILIMAVSELGHLGAARYLGIKTGNFCLVSSISIFRPKTKYQMFWVWYCGPLVGFIETALLATVNFSLIKSEMIWLVVAASALLNQLSLLPILPLDGGRIILAIDSHSVAKYLNGWFYYLMTALSFIILFNVIGFIFSLLVLIIGYLERNYLINRENKNGVMQLLNAPEMIKAIVFCFLLYGGSGLLLFLAVQRIIPVLV